MACHPMFLWPRFRKKVHSWGRSSRYTHQLERFAEAFGQLVVKHYRVSEEEQPWVTPGVTQEWVPVYAEAAADFSVVSGNSHERSVLDSGFYRKLVVVAVAMICLVYMDELVAIGVIMLTVSVAFASCKFLEESSSTTTTIQQQQHSPLVLQQQPMPSLKIPSSSRPNVCIDNEPRSAPSSPRSSSQDSGSIKSRRKLFKSKILASMPAASGNSMASALLSPNMLSRKFHSFALRKEEVDSPSNSSTSFENSSSAPLENSSCSRLKEIRTITTKQRGYPGGDQVSVVATILVIVLASLVLGRIPAILAASGSWFIISKLDTMWNSGMEDRRAGLVVGGRAQDEGDN